VSGTLVNADQLQLPGSEALQATGLGTINACQGELTVTVVLCIVEPTAPVQVIS
jgi:hypothetical protein